MPSISFWELMMVCLAVVVFVKPEELPRFLRTLGQAYGKFTAYTQRLKDYGRDTYHDITALDDPDRLGPPGSPGTGTPGIGTGMTTGAGTADGGAGDPAVANADTQPPRTPLAHDYGRPRDAAATSLPADQMFDLPPPPPKPPAVPPVEPPRDRPPAPPRGPLDQP